LKHHVGVGRSRHDIQSVQSAAGELLFKRMALKCCIITKIHWNKKLVACYMKGSVMPHFSAILLNNSSPAADCTVWISCLLLRGFLTAVSYYLYYMLLLVVVMVILLLAVVVMVVLTM